MPTDQVLSHVKKYEQLLDLEIASATGIALVQVRKSLAELTTRGEISQCSVTHFKGNSVLTGFSAGFWAMCRPSRQVERLGLPEASIPTKNGAAIEAVQESSG